MSEPDGSSSDTDLSQPSSPIANLELSSPVHETPSSPDVPDFSPPTSPFSSPRKRKRQEGEISRSTLIRMRCMERELQSEAESDFIHEEGSDENNSCTTQGSEHVAECLELRDEYNHQPSGSGGESISNTEGSASEEDSSEETDDVSSANESNVPSSPSDSNSSGSSSGNDSESSDSNRNSDSSDESDEDPPLYESSPMKSNEALLGQLKLYVQETWTKKSLDRNVKFIKKLLPKQNSFPTSGKDALKKLENLTSPFMEDEYLYCTGCKQLADKCLCPCECEDSEEECQHCKEKEIIKFYSFSLGAQVKHMFEHRDLSLIIDHHRCNRISREGFISDVLDGSVYATVKEHLSDPYDIALIWNSDGVSLSASSKQEMWPILAVICEVPPRLRPSFMLVAGVFIGKEKPNMNVYLKPFVESLQKFFTSGISWVHPVSKLTYTSKIVAPFLVADAPARSLILIHKSFSHKYGCTVCEQKTKKVALTANEIIQNQNQPNPRKRIKRKRRFLFVEDQALLRTGARMNDQGRVAANRGKPCKGVQGQAVVSNIPLFDRASSVCAEYLHLILLGVVKYFLEKIFFKQGPWFIGKFLREIDNFIATIKVPDFVKRLPRSLTDFHYWKASELRNFLLFFSLPMLKKYLPDRYFQHWLLLVGATHILLKEAISMDEVDRAQLMLRAFVRDLGVLYGNSCYTYNVHNLLHLSLLIKRSGNLWATSAFCFESFNGFIGKSIHGTKHLGKEFINNVKISQKVAILDNIVNSPMHIFPRPRQDSLVTLGKPTSLQCLEESDRNGVINCADLNNPSLYLRIQFNSVVYTSKYYDKNKKRANSFVQFKTPEKSGYREIVCFVNVEENESLFCFINTFNVNHVDIFFHDESRSVIRNLVPVELSVNFALISMEDIKTKLLKVGNYLCVPPNSIEINL